MSEQEEERPLTRREMRLREQAAQEVAEQLNDEDAQPNSEAAEETVDYDIEIDPLNADGTPRTRRELRALRLAAISELDAQRAVEPEVTEEVVEPESADEPEVSEEPEASEDPEATVEPEASEDPEVSGDPEASEEPEAAADDELSPELDATEESDEPFDESYGAPTEAFTLDELLDAAAPTSTTADADAVAALFADAEDEDEPGSETDLPSEGAIDVDSGSEADSAVVSDTDDDSVEPDADADEALVEVVIPAEAVEDLPFAPDESLETEADAASEVEAAADDGDGDSEPGGYSFPDIQPPEEWRSVFDDPTRGAKITAPESSGDFDDLISRAVAQEGSTGSTGASALILPSHPGDTGGLMGPLGATGELFVTGSIDLPKSLGETGGHTAVQRSRNVDPYISGEHPDSLTSASDSGSMPVSAMRAVSARRSPETPVVAEPTKDKSRAPLVLAVSGGALIVVLAGAVIFAATQGLFG